jgi:predicted RNase H-like nuclease (RuvC/YqgF family)
VHTFDGRVISRAQERRESYNNFLVRFNRNPKYQAYLFGHLRDEWPALRKELYTSEQTSKQLKREIYELKRKCKQHEKEYAPQIAMEQKVSALEKEKEALKEEKDDLQMRVKQLEIVRKAKVEQLHEAWQNGSAFENLCNIKEKKLQRQIDTLEAALEAAAANDQVAAAAATFTSSSKQQQQPAAPTAAVTTTQGQTAGNTKKRQRCDPRASAESAGRTSGNSGDVSHTKPQQLTSSHISHHLTSTISHLTSTSVRYEVRFL